MADLQMHAIVDCRPKIWIPPKIDKERISSLDLILFLGSQQPNWELDEIVVSHKNLVTNHFSRVGQCAVSWRVGNHSTNLQTGDYQADHEGEQKYALDGAPNE